MLTCLKKQIKRSLSSLLYTFYVKRARDLKTPKQGLLLVIAPHPDDESFGCGALIARHRKAGQPVHIIVVTDGGASAPKANITRHELVARRQQETLTAASKLNCERNSVTFLSYQDGATTEQEERLSIDLSHHIQKIKPTLIAAPFIVDAHADHVFVATALLQIKLQTPILFYPMWFWPKKAVSLLLNPHGYKSHKLDAQAYLETKEKAIRSHRSQFENITGSKEWGYLDSHIINMQLQPYELFFTLPDPPEKL